MAAAGMRCCRGRRHRLSWLLRTWWDSASWSPRADCFGNENTAAELATAVGIAALPPAAATAQAPRNEDPGLRNRSGIAALT